MPTTQGAGEDASSWISSWRSSLINRTQSPQRIQNQSGSDFGMRKWSEIWEWRKSFVFFHSAESFALLFETISFDCFAKTTWSLVKDSTSFKIGLKERRSFFHRWDKTRTERVFSFMTSERDRVFLSSSKKQVLKRDEGDPWSCNKWSIISSKTFEWGDSPESERAFVAETRRWMIDRERRCRLLQSKWEIWEISFLKRNSCGTASIKKKKKKEK